MVSTARRRDVELKVVSREEHVKYYVEERGMDQGLVEWWSRTYDALRAGECEIRDSALEDLIALHGRTPKQLSETVREMLG